MELKPLLSPMVVALLTSSFTMLMFHWVPTMSFEKIVSFGLHSINRTLTTTLESGVLRPSFPVSFLEPIHELSHISREEEEEEFWPQLKDSTCHYPKEDTVEEALSAVSLAISLNIKGKSTKADKLFSHALTLQPNHPDILAEYGNFVETIQKDYLQAQHLYNKALLISPTHDLAKQGQRRTQPLVEEIDNQMLSVLDAKRSHFLRIPKESLALNRAKRESYFQHVYHSVAIEGNTMTLVETRVILETRMAIAGKSILEHNEILGMDAALRFLNQSLSERRIGYLTLREILDLHARVLGFVDPIVAGRFRTTQVYVGSFTPPDPTKIAGLMEEFVQWLNDPSTISLHPIELAAIAHYKFVYIHPFIDGNGRTARLIMNWILMQAGFPPVIIKVEDRLQYYETLKLANEGHLRPFIRFIAKCTDVTLNGYLHSTLEDASTIIPEIESQTRRRHQWSNGERTEDKTPLIIAVLHTLHHLLSRFTLPFCDMTNSSLEKAALIRGTISVKHTDYAKLTCLSMPTDFDAREMEFQGEEEFCQKDSVPTTKIRQTWIFADFPAKLRNIRNSYPDGVAVSQSFPENSLPQWQMSLQSFGEGFQLALKLKKAVKGRSAVADCSFKILDDNGKIITETTRANRRFHTGWNGWLYRLFNLDTDSVDYSEVFLDVESVVSQSAKLIIRADISY